MERASTYRTVACDGCARFALVLSVVDGAKLCDGCAEKSARIDRSLATTLSEDPVHCDSCDDRVLFDARIAVVVRECGGGVLCEGCKPFVLEREAS